MRPGLQVPLRHLAQVHGLVVGLLVDAHLKRDLAEGAARVGGLLDDLGRLVVADVGVQGGGGGQRRLGRAAACPPR